MKGISFTLFLALIVLLIGFYALIKPTITGIIIYEEAINTLNWTFDNINDFSYDSSLTSLSNGEAKLVKSIVEDTWSITNFTDVNVVSALEYEPGKKIHNRTNKIGSLDGDSININKDDEIFDVAFNKKLSDGDIISLYTLKSDDDEEDDNENSNTHVYLCDNGISCSEPGYGSVNLNGSEGWHNITITGMGEAKDTFNIKPSKNTEFDYIKAVHKDTIAYTSTNISYPKSASIETKDISIAGLSSFLNFHKNDMLNGQNIGYYYSLDSGSSWNSMPSNNNLSGVSVSNRKIRIKADIATNGSGTPIIYDFSVSYLAKICNENWNATYGACLSNNTKLRYYIDKNECGTKNNLPSDNGTYESCVYDKPQNQTEILIDARNKSNVLISIRTTSNIPTDSISITEYRTNSKNSTPSLKELGKYIDITADDAIKQNLTTITIRIYYTDADVSHANLDEETLEIHYFNGTSNQWQILNSTVNTTGNYVEVTIDHLSTFGIFGEEKATQNSESSGSTSGGSSGGKTRIIRKTEETTDQKVTEEEIKEEVEKKEEKIEMEEEKECNYQISVSMPEHVSFVEYDLIEGIISNIGNCEIKNINIDVSPELRDIINIENEKIENIVVNESVEFLLLRKLENRTNLLIQGFNIKIPKKDIKTYTGSLTFGAIIQEELAFEEKINVKVDLLENLSIIELVGSKISILLITFLLFIVIFFVFYSRFYQNKSEKLTQKQIEEKVEITKKKYYDGKK